MNPIIQIDTREQCPLHITEFETERASLATGDYGIEGFSDWTNPAFVIERKSLPDLIGSLTGGRERFMKEVERMRRFRFSAILIEGTRKEVERGEYRSQANPQAILGTLAAIEVRAGVHVLWCGDAAGAAVEVERLARVFIGGVLKDAKRLEGVS